MSEKRSAAFTEDGPAAKRIKLSSGSTVDLSTLDGNVVLYAASFLSATDLVHLGRTCSRFGVSKYDQQRSLTNESARQTFECNATDDIRNALPQYDGESDVSLLHQLHLLHKPLEFKQLIGNHIHYTPEKSRTQVSMGTNGQGRNCAVSNFVMRGGKHFSSFAISQEADKCYIDIGVIRPLPGWNKKGLDSFDPVYVYKFHDVSQDLLAERTEKWGTSDINCCSYYCEHGNCCWSNWSDFHTEQYEGMESFNENGTIGLLLDLDEGTLTVYKNGRLLGVMKKGLFGEYCWYISMTSRGDTVSIKRGTLP